jgi:hypothetical protein
MTIRGKGFGIVFPLGLLALSALAALTSLSYRKRMRQVQELSDSLKTLL